MIRYPSVNIMRHAQAPVRYSWRRLKLLLPYRRQASLEIMMDACHVLSIKIAAAPERFFIRRFYLARLESGAGMADRRFFRELSLPTNLYSCSEPVRV